MDFDCLGLIKLAGLSQKVANIPSKSKVSLRSSSLVADTFTKCLVLALQLEGLALL